MLLTALLVGLLAWLVTTFPATTATIIASTAAATTTTVSSTATAATAATAAATLKGLPQAVVARGKLSSVLGEDHGSFELGSI